MADPNPDTPTTAAELDRRAAQAAAEARKHANRSQYFGLVRNDADWLYRREESKALMQIDGANADERKSEKRRWRLTEDVRDEAVDLLCEPLGQDDYRPETVDDLRYLREMADTLSSSAYKRWRIAMNEQDQCRSTGAWARAEYEHAMTGPASAVEGPA